MIPSVPVRSRLLVALATFGLAAGGCAGATASPAPPAASSATSSAAPGADPSAAPSSTAKGYHLGISNTEVNDGWGEALLCSIKAEALTSGDVAELTISNRVTDAAGQLADIRNLIAVGVDAIIVNPVSLDALDAAVKEAIDAGIVVVGVDQPVAQDGAYLMANDQEAYGYLGAKWLFETMGDKGSVVVMRGTAGDPVDSQRDVGFRRALAESPDIKVAFESQTDWDETIAVEQINAFLATKKKIGGIWTSGIDSVIVDALKIAGSPLVPIVGTDHGAFVSQLLAEEGLVGAAVTNPAAVGGAGVRLALQILDGQIPAEPKVLVDPEVWDNSTDAGKARLTEANDPRIDLPWPLQISIPEWTTYSKDEILACEGPGD